jgi:hypothetical protein
MDDLWWLLELVISICVVGIIGYGFNKINEENYDKKRKNL